MTGTPRSSWVAQARERGVLRVAASYAVIGWLLLQIADVTFDPLGLPGWAMTALIFAVVLGFPVALLFAWFYELGDTGITRDQADAAIPRPRVHGLRRHADIVLIGLLLVTVAVLLVRQSDYGKPPPPARPSLAVLPFANLSADPAQQYFSDGLAEEVLDRLSQVPGLLVVARSSSFSYRDSDVDVRDVAQQLGVNAVLEGSVRRDGKRLRLTAKLLDGKSGYQLWSGSFDREVNDVFAVQAELAQAVIDAIAPVARGDQPVNAKAAPPPTTSLTAYDLYLLGRAQANTRWSSSMQRAAEYFDQAVQLDPKFARAQAALANARVYQINDQDLREPPRERRIELAEAAVYQALALDPGLSDSQLALANFLRATRREGVEQAYKRALATNANNADAWHSYSIFLGEQTGREREEQEAVERAHRLDPLAVGPWMNHIHSVIRPGGEELRAELARARAAFTNQPDALRRFAIVAGSSGYPLEAWQLVTETRKDPSFTLPRSTSAVGPLGLWMFVDPGYVLLHGKPLLDDPETGSAWLTGMLITAAGLSGQREDVIRLFDRYDDFPDAEPKHLAVTQAFWLAVLGDFQDAAQALAEAEPVTDDTFGTWDLTDGQMLPAKLRIYRATGRVKEANELAKSKLAAYRAERPRNPEVTIYGLWMRDAALAASEGLKDEAVECLRQALQWEDVPRGFAPQLPWFKALEGYPPYDELLQLRAERVAKAKAGMLALDAALPGASPSH